MLQQEKQTEVRDLERICEGVSPMDDTCEAKATYHCGVCGKWFCAFHAKDEAWHPIAWHAASPNQRKQRSRPYAHRRSS